MKTIGLLDIINSIGTVKIKIIKAIDLILGTLIATLVKAKSPEETIPHVNKILIIRPGGIGDAIFLLPFLRVIRKNHPDIQVDILCEKRNAQVFKSQQDICHAVLCYDNYSEFKQLKNASYDVVIDTEQWHYLSALVSYFIKSQVTVGFATRRLRAKLFSKPVEYIINGYELDNFRNLFEGLFPEAGKVTTIQNSFEIDAQALTWAKNKLTHPGVSLFLGASIPLRRLTQPLSLDIISFLLGKFYHIALLGGADIVKSGEELHSKVMDSRVQNFVGNVSLLETAALIKCSRFFMGPDSGIMHLACAVGTPVIAIFGPGNIKKWGPQGANDKIVSLYLECSPCTRFGYTVPTCQKSYNCLENINLNHVLIQLIQKVKSAKA